MTLRRCLVWVLGGLLLSSQATVLAADLDGDGVPDDRDVCNNTPPGIAVNYCGRPYADLDEDCDVDLDDYAILANQFTGPLDMCPDGTPCDDGLDCTIDDACLDGLCVGTPVDARCDDNLYCNGTESCEIGLGCLPGAAVDCSHLDDICQLGICNDTLEMCEVADRPDETPCDDESVCTTNDNCVGGECLGTVLPDQSLCDDGDPGTDRSICAFGQCLASTVYLPSTSLNYSCPAGGLSYNVALFEFADDGDTLTVFGAPVPMTGPGGIGPADTFEVSGTLTDGACQQVFLLDGQFNGETWTGRFRIQLFGCGACSWPTWNNVIGTPQ